MTAPAIRTTGLTRRFGQTTALDSVSVEVAPGGICALLGRNGAGKTTFMSLVTGQDRPTTGRVEVAGHVPFEHAPTLSALSFIRDNQRYPDDYRLHHVLRAAQRFRPNWDDALARDLVAAFRLPAKVVVKKYSRGQLSALAIVLGMASRAPVTLLDEPYLGLDGTARQIFYDTLLTDQLAHPRTFLVSTHLVSEMERLFTQVIVLDGGRVVLDAATDEVRGSFEVVSGHGAAVAEAVAGLDVVHTRAIGPLRSVTVRGRLDRARRGAASERGLSVEVADLQAVVSALGSMPTDTEGDDHV